MLLEMAIAQFPTSIVPKEEPARRELINIVEENPEGTWEFLDSNYYVREEDLDSLIVEYLKLHIY